MLAAIPSDKREIVPFCRSNFIHVIYVSFPNISFTSEQ